MSELEGKFISVTGPGGQIAFPLAARLDRCEVELENRRRSHDRGPSSGASLPL